MINDTNNNEINTINRFEYLLNWWLHAIQFNHVDLLSSDVQYNADIHFVVLKINNDNLFSQIKTNSNSNNPISITIEDVVALNPFTLLVVIGVYFQLLIVVYCNSNSTNMVENNKLYHQNTTIVNFIDGKVDENVMAVAVFMIGVSMETIVTLKSLEHLFNILVYNYLLIIQRCTERVKIGALVCHAHIVFDSNGCLQAFISKITANTSTIETKEHMSSLFML